MMKSDQEKTAGEVSCLSPVKLVNTLQKVLVNSVKILLILPFVLRLTLIAFKVNSVERHTNITDLGQLIVTFNKCVCMPTKVLRFAI